MALLRKKAIKRLPEEDKEKLHELLEKKQVSRFLMPDAPSRKTRKKKSLSPERILCPLSAGTPKILSSCAPHPRELKSRGPDSDLSELATNDSVLGAASVLNVSGPATPDKPLPTKTCAPMMITLSTEVVTDAQVLDINGSEAERGDNYEYSIIGPASQGPSSSSAVAHGFLFEDDTDENIIGDKNNENLGSDIDEEGDSPTTTNAVFRTDLASMEDLTPELLNVLYEMDQRDDIALRTLANENMLDFSWSSDPSVFIGQREVFTGQPGPTFSIEGLTPFEIFKKIWDSNIISLIIRETNKYAEALKHDTQNKPHAEINKWTPISEVELWKFFSILMLQSLIPLPVESEYWKPRYKYLKVGNFEKIMTYNSFMLIKRCLHFVDNAGLSFNSQNRLGKIQSIIDHLNEKFSSLYLPDQEIALDESLLMWKGRFSLVQLIKTKVARVGIKSYELCESKSGYLWKMSIYAGKGQAETPEEHSVTEDPEPEGAISKIVFNLVRPLLHLGHTLVMDNFYNSPLLSRTLKGKKTDTMGTLRLNREFVPESLRNKSKSNMRPGEVAFSQTRDLTITVWNDFRVVGLISTFHQMEVDRQEKDGYYRYKPRVVIDYNMSMGGVDKKDQLLQAYPMERIRNRIWYKKLFRRFLNVSIHNAHVIFSTGIKIPAREFRYRLVDEILQKFSPISPKTSVVVEAEGHHFPAKTEKRKSRCQLCYRNNKDVRTVWKCANCNVNLCMPDCFRNFHLNRK